MLILPFHKIIPAELSDHENALQIMFIYYQKKDKHNCILELIRKKQYLMLIILHINLTLFFVEVGVSMYQEINLVIVKT